VSTLAVAWLEPPPQAVKDPSRSAPARTAELARAVEFRSFM
jgi:hypothetical protein